jgi:hypothetical protein
MPTAPTLRINGLAEAAFDGGETSSARMTTTVTAETKRINRCGNGFLRPGWRAAVNLLKSNLSFVEGGM